MTARALVWFWTTTCRTRRGRSTRAPPRLLEPRVTKLPPTWLDLCERDPLRDEGLE